METAVSTPTPNPRLVGSVWRVCCSTPSHTRGRHHQSIAALLRQSPEIASESVSAQDSQRPLVTDGAGTVRIPSAVPSAERSHPVAELLLTSDIPP